MNTKYPIGITDLRHQSDHITSKKIQLLQEYGADLDNTRLFVILVRRIEWKSKSHYNNIYKREQLNK